MARMTADYTKTCQSCAQNKPIMYANYRKLLPLQVPSALWQRIGMDMIIDLLTTKKTYHDYILVVVDYFTKMEHFVPCRKTLNAEGTANLFINTVICHHGIPVTIVPDRDKY